MRPDPSVENWRRGCTKTAAALVLILTSAGCTDDELLPPPVPVMRPAATESGALDSAAARLSYQLDIPARTARVPAVVIGHGSGRTTKQACRFLSSAFLARGFATLCYDKRGVGQSTGDYSGVGTQNSIRMFDLLAEDMAAGVRFLRGHDAIDATRVGLAGNSQAGWIIPLAAARVQPAFMILLAGPTVSVGEEIFYSDIVEQTNEALDVAYDRLRSFTGARGFDPRPVLESLNVPGLWLLGAQDRSIPTPATAAILDELSARGRPFRRVVFSGAGHELGGAAVWDEIDRWLNDVQPPELQLALIGNAAVRISDGRLTLMTDFPYRSGAFGYMTYSPSEVIGSGNVLTLITHRHDDHVDVDALKALSWRVVGPQEVTRQLSPTAVVPATAAATVDRGLRVDALTTPHANVEHLSYVVEWHGRRFYFSGDTEDPASLLAQQRLDIAFVSPWIYRSVQSRGARIAAARVVIYHHRTGEQVSGCTAPCEVPAQGAQWSLAGR